MAKLSKRYSAVRAKVDRTKVYPAQEALELAKAFFEDILLLSRGDFF